MSSHTIRRAIFGLATLGTLLLSAEAIAGKCDKPLQASPSSDDVFTPDCLWFGVSGAIRESEYPGQEIMSSFPEIHVEQGPFYWINTAVGVVIARSRLANATLGIALQLSVPDSGFVTDNSSVFRRLDAREPTLEGGFVMFTGGRGGRFELDIGVDIESRHDGLRAAMRYSYPIAFGAISMVPRMSWVVQDASRSHYYYGVDQDEASEASQNTYTIDQPATQFVVGWTISREFQKRYLLFNTVELRRFDESISASPLTNKNTAYYSSIGVMYRFY